MVTGFQVEFILTENHISKNKLVKKNIKLLGETNNLITFVLSKYL